MARSIRIEYAGAYYHVMARGNRRAAIFNDDDDRRFYLKTLSETCGMTGWRVHSWVLMGNHYHLMIETPEPNLVEGMGWLQNTYTRRFNTRHQAWGRLFGDRYKSVVVEGSVRDYYCTLVDYIHLNPVRAGLVNLQKGGNLLDYEWSSLASGYAVLPRRRAKWLAVEAGLEAFGYEDTTAERRRFIERLEKRAREDEKKQCGIPAWDSEEDCRMSNLRRGWYWGSQAFAEQLLKLVEKNPSKPKSRVYGSAGARKLHGMKRAEEMLREGLEREGLTEEDLKKTVGCDPRKNAIALAIRSETTASLGWLAEEVADAKRSEREPDTTASKTY